tara:strand:- start:696 stop:1109 length:414 start_codon:yes stop_codon:yes gene_type:complete
MKKEPETPTKLDLFDSDELDELEKIYAGLVKQGLRYRTGAIVAHRAMAAETQKWFNGIAQHFCDAPTHLIKAIATCREYITLAGNLARQQKTIEQKFVAGSSDILKGVEGERDQLKKEVGELEKEIAELKVRLENAG